MPEYRVVVTVTYQYALSGIEASNAKHAEKIVKGMFADDIPGLGALLEGEITDVYIESEDEGE